MTARLAHKARARWRTLAALGALAAAELTIYVARCIG